MHHSLLHPCAGSGQVCCGNSENAPFLLRYESFFHSNSAILVLAYEVSTFHSVIAFCIIAFILRDKPYTYILLAIINAYATQGVTYHNDCYLWCMRKMWRVCWVGKIDWLYLDSYKQCIPAMYSPLRFNTINLTGTWRGSNIGRYETR